MEIRANLKDYKKFKILLDKNHNNAVTLTLDTSVDIATMMVFNKKEDGSPTLVEWMKGRKYVISFLKTGVVHFRKNCPHRIGKCIGEKCSYYLVKNAVGDCAVIWNAVK